MKRVFLWMVLTLFLTSGLVFSEEKSSAPRIVEKALKQYGVKGSEGFMHTLLGGSPVDTGQNVQFLAGELKQVETAYGKYMGYGGVRKVVVSPLTALFFIVIHYEHGPLFSISTLYGEVGKEVVVGFDFHTEISKLEGVSPFFD